MQAYLAEVSKDLRPRAQAAYAEAHAKAQQLLAHPQVSARPLQHHCQACKSTPSGEYVAVSTSPQVKGFCKRLEAVLDEVESFLASHLRQVPMLAPYADKPYSMRLVYLLVAAPLLAAALPLLLLGGAKPRRVEFLPCRLCCVMPFKKRSCGLAHRPTRTGLCRPGSSPQGGVVAEQRGVGERAQQGAATCSPGGSGQEEGQGKVASQVAGPCLLVIQCSHIFSARRGGGSRLGRTPSACQSSMASAESAGGWMRHVCFVILQACIAFGFSWHLSVWCARGCAACCASVNAVYIA